MLLPLLVPFNSAEGKGGHAIQSVGGWVAASAQFNSPTCFGLLGTFSVSLVAYWYCVVIGVPRLCVNNILGHAVAVERVFSGGRDTILLQRASPTKVQRSILIKSYM
jgi:hypothetical protein